MESTQSTKNTKYLPAGTTEYVINGSDDFIQVNTSATPVKLYLPNIVGSGLLFNPKKFYISDSSGNAATNNITIYPSGNNQVNSGASVVLNTNGVTCECVISSQTEYLINKDSAQSGGGGITGNGTINTIAVFIGATAIGNSIITQPSATEINIGGNLKIVGGLIIDSSDADSIDTNGRVLYDVAGNATVDWDNTTLKSISGTSIFSWSDSGVSVFNGSLLIDSATTAYPQIHLNSGVAPTTPVSGDIYYTTAATTGFNFYSNDATNTGNLATFLNSVNSLGLYIDTVAINGLILLYPQTATRFGFAANSGDTVNYEMSPTGNHGWVGGTNASGSTGSFLFTNGTKTNQTVNTEVSAFSIAPGTTQWATGALTVTQGFVNVSQPVMSFVGASASTFAATLRVRGGVIAGTNATITTNVALYVDAVASVGAATATSYGIYCKAQTGATTNFSAAFIGPVQVTGRLLQTQGASVASANNLVLGSDGNAFEITGTTQVNLISNLTWQNGSKITLLFTSTPTIKNGQATSTTNITILLAGAADFVATSGDTLSLILSTVGGIQAWRETSRAVI